MKAANYQGLHNLVAPVGARKKPKRVGRGEGSGLGKTSGRGHKGQKARKSGNVRIGFEGGQNPIARSHPKRGFSNADFKQEYQIVNLGRVSERFDKDATVDKQTLLAAGLISSKKMKVKVLAKGELKHAIKLNVDAVSKSVEKAVKEKGGTVQLIGNK